MRRGWKGPEHRGGKDSRFLPSLRFGRNDKAFVAALGRNDKAFALRSVGMTNVFMAALDRND
jgi:hypothetical protein